MDYTIPALQVIDNVFLPEIPLHNYGAKELRLLCDKLDTPAFKEALEEDVFICVAASYITGFSHEDSDTTNPSRMWSHALHRADADRKVFTLGGYLFGPGGPGYFLDDESEKKDASQISALMEVHNKIGEIRQQWVDHTIKHLQIALQNEVVQVIALVGNEDPYQYIKVLEERVRLLADTIKDSVVWMDCSGKHAAYLLDLVASSHQIIAPKE